MLPVALSDHPHIGEGTNTAGRSSEALVLLVMSQRADGVYSIFVKTGASKNKGGVCSHCRDVLGKKQPPALLF